MGEKALENDAKWNASIVAVEDCYLLLLMKQDYIVIIEDYKKVEKQKNIDFFRSLPLMFQWNFEKIKKFVDKIGIKPFKHKEDVYS